MIAYLDTSALLRLVLREPGALEELPSCEALVSTELLAVESLRTIDRLRLRGALSVEEEPRGAGRSRSGSKPSISCCFSVRCWPGLRNPSPRR